MGKEGLVFVVDDAGVVSRLVNDEVVRRGVGFYPFGGGDRYGVWAREVALAEVAGEGEEEDDGGGGGFLENRGEGFFLEPFERKLATEAEEGGEKDEIGEIVVVLGGGGFAPESPEDKQGDEVVEPEAGGEVGFEGFEDCQSAGDGETGDGEGNDEGEVVGDEGEPVVGTEAGCTRANEGDEVFHS